MYAMPNVPMHTLIHFHACAHSGDPRDLSDAQLNEAMKRFFAMSQASNTRLNRDKEQEIIQQKQRKKAIKKANAKLYDRITMISTRNKPVFPTYGKAQRPNLNITGSMRDADKIRQMVTGNENEVKTESFSRKLGQPLDPVKQKISKNRQKLLEHRAKCAYRNASAYTSPGKGKKGKHTKPLLLTSPSQYKPATSFDHTPIKRRAPKKSASSRDPFSPSANKTNPKTPISTFSDSDSEEESDGQDEGEQDILKHCPLIKLCMDNQTNINRASKQKKKAKAEGGQSSQ
jgi:hypothetical protein